MTARHVVRYGSLAYLALILLAPVALAVITTLIAFGYPRFRYAADVSLIAMGAVWLETVGRQAAARPRRQAGWSRV